MSCRAGIIVTGTEVLTGRVTDRNGPWVVERLRELGIDAAHIAVVGDRPDDISGALRFFAAEGMDLVVSSGGLGPTADDLTATVVGEFQGRAMVLDAALEERIAEILRPFAERWPDLDPEALREANRKQAVVPAGATILEPIGTAPGLVVPPADADYGGGGPTIVVLPGPPRELQPMWEAAVATDAFTAATGGRTRYVQHVVRLFGTPESEIAQTLRRAQADGIDVEALEVTTCQRRAELEVVTRYEDRDAETYAALVDVIRARHVGALFSDDGSTVDEQVAALLRERGLRVATAESCTGGLIAGRLTDLPGSSAYVVGGVVSYADAVKTELLGVDAALIAEHGAVSEPVAEAMAVGALASLGADVAIGVTGIAGPDGGTQAKPVGTVVFAVATCDDGPVLTLTQVLPGRRTDVRDWSTTVALHLLRRVLRGEGAPSSGEPRA